MDRRCALLFTDIVDSTELNSRLGDAAMGAVWAEHDDKARALLARLNGSEVDRADGFFLTFENVCDAAAYAIGYHALLAAMLVPLRARAGLHFGTISDRSNDPALAPPGKRSEVFGLAKAVASRLQHLALPGQTLASDEASRALVGGRWRCVSYGYWRLKGVHEPVQLWGVGDSESALLIPPADGEKAQRVVRIDGQWVGLRNVPRNLPAERDAFFGRDADLRVLSARFESGARLVVIRGPGGIGKTRLAVRYGWGWLGEHPGGVYFCDLASAQTADGVLHGIARGLDVALSAEPHAQLTHAIDARERCLLIVDNAEHVASHSAHLLSHWMDRCPHARFLVTSQRALGLVGEQTLALGTIALSDAAALFHDRATTADNRHCASDWPDAVVRPLMMLLDGLPLAIELAAARANVLAPEDMLARMQRRWDLLRGNEDRPPRQATLRAAIDWSFRLLEDNERAAIAQLTVFENGFTVAAAEAVIDLDQHAAISTLDLVQSLMAKSLLQAGKAGRVWMSSAVHAYATEQLMAMPCLHHEALRRHMRHFGDFGEREATANRCADLDNLIVACRRACVMQQGSDATRCLVAAWFALRMSGPFSVALELARAAIGVVGADPTQRAEAHWVVAAASLAMGELPAAIEHATTAARHLPADASSALRARIGCTAAEAQGLAGHEAAARFAAADASAAALVSGDAGLRCHAASASGALALRRGDLKLAQERYSDALTTAESAKLVRWQSAILGNLALIAFQSGDLGHAGELYESALTLAGDGGDGRWEANARCNLGLIRHEQGRTADAEAQLTLALVQARQMGHRALEYTTHCNLGLMHEARGDMAAACIAHAAAVAGMEGLGDAQTEAQFRFYFGIALMKAARCVEARACLDRGLALVAPDNLPTRALLQCGLSHVCLEENRPDLARAELAAAREIQKSLQWNDRSELGQRIAACAERIESADGQGARHSI